MSLEDNAGLWRVNQVFLKDDRSNLILTFFYGQILKFLIALFLFYEHFLLILTGNRDNRVSLLCNL